MRKACWISLVVLWIQVACGQRCCYSVCNAILDEVSCISWNQTTACDDINKKVICECGWISAEIVEQFGGLQCDFVGEEYQQATKNIHFILFGSLGGVCCLCACCYQCLKALGWEEDVSHFEAKHQDFDPSIDEAFAARDARTGCALRGAKRVVHAVRRLSAGEISPAADLGHHLARGLRRSSSAFLHSLPRRLSDSAAALSSPLSLPLPLPGPPGLPPTVSGTGTGPGRPGPAYALRPQDEGSDASVSRSLQPVSAAEEKGITVSAVPVTATGGLENGRSRPPGSFKLSVGTGSPGQQRSLRAPPTEAESTVTHCQVRADSEGSRLRCDADTSRGAALGPASRKPLASQPERDSDSDQVQLRAGPRTPTASGNWSYRHRHSRGHGAIATGSLSSKQARAGQLEHSAAGDSSALRSLAGPSFKLMAQAGRAGGPGPRQPRRRVPVTVGEPEPHPEGTGNGDLLPVANGPSSSSSCVHLAEKEQDAKVVGDDATNLNGGARASGILPHTSSSLSPSTGPVANAFKLMLSHSLRADARLQVESRAEGASLPVEPSDPCPDSELFEDARVTMEGPEERNSKLNLRARVLSGTQAENLNVEAARVPVRVEGSPDSDGFPRTLKVAQ